MSEREIFGEWSREAGQAVEGRMLVDVTGQLDLQVKAPLGEADRIGGRLSDGSPATLFSAELLRRDSKEHFFEEYRIGTAILGLDLADPEEDCLIAAAERIGGLEQLVGTSGLSLEAPNAEAEQRRSAAIAWPGSDPIKVPLPGCELRLVDFTRFERDSDFRYSLQHVAEARLEAGDPLCLESINEVFDVLAAFIAFAIEARVAPGPMSITTAVGAGAQGEVLVKRRPQSVCWKGQRRQRSQLSEETRSYSRASSETVATTGRTIRPTSRARRSGTMSWRLSMTGSSSWFEPVCSTKSA
jgi:hypothetical protein